MEKYHQAKQNKKALQATRATQYREIPWADLGYFNTADTAMLPSRCRAKRDKVTIKNCVYVLDYADNEMRCGVMNGTIPSTVADSGATSNVGTEDKNPCILHT